MAAPRKENIKEIVLKTTKELLKTKTFSDISLAEVAKAAGISKGTLYYHYKTKGEIFFDLTDRHLAQQWDDLIAWTENKEKDTSLPRLVKYVIERNVDNASFRMQLYNEAQCGDENVKRKLNQRYDDFQKLISEKISERTDFNADYLTWMMLLISDGIIVQTALDNPNFDRDKFIDESVKHLIKVLNL